LPDCLSLTCLPASSMTVNLWTCLTALPNAWSVCLPHSCLSIYGPICLSHVWLSIYGRVCMSHSWLSVYGPVCLPHALMYSWVFCLSICMPSCIGETELTWSTALICPYAFNAYFQLNP
jgi:hypothetical protein